MEKAEYPITPTKPREGHGYGGSPANTAQSALGSAQSINKHSSNVEETISQLYKAIGRRKKESAHWQISYKNTRKANRDLKDRVSQLTIDNANMESSKTIYEDKYGYIVNKAILPYAEAAGLQFDDRTKASVDTVMEPFYNDAMTTLDVRNELRPDDVEMRVLKDELMASRLYGQSLEEQNQFQETEIQKLRQDLESSKAAVENSRTQTQVLQKEMLARVPKIQAISDEAFSRRFHTLASMVKSLSRSVRITPEVDVLAILQPPMLNSDVPDTQWSNRARKKAYIEAWIWSTLLEMVFSSPFVFCRRLAKTLHDAWFHLFGDVNPLEWPEPSPESENWRCTTIEKLMDRIGRETITEGQTQGKNRQSDEKTRDLQISVIQSREKVSEFITTNLTAIYSGTDFSHVLNIVNQAFALSLDMSLQRSRIQMTWSNIGTDFVAEHMSAIPDRNGEDIREGVVAFIVSPGLTKWGDANGNHFDKCHDLVPSLVQIEPRQNFV
ncbi:hypothetical protein J4E90_008129 [Alternaria incomplexa]|uniref:uncharacterized protein n=1 Tax=Alternaria incomplexa TaxID=1187928 RepID=UPI002220E9F8|nr:uncharacterized protein J4E90_008129 [Alternaria incomplexa]KAI4909432.1 hypothetical protein J4E90_008129 [Alternaria incomplexa]